MATKSKPWPRNAEYARVDCIAVAMRIEREAQELLLHDHDPIERMRMLVQVKDLAREIRVKLDEVKE